MDNIFMVSSAVFLIVICVIVVIVWCQRARKIQYAFRMTSTRRQKLSIIKQGRRYLRRAGDRHHADQVSKFLEGLRTTQKWAHKIDGDLAKMAGKVVGWLAACDRPRSNMLRATLARVRQMEKQW